MTAQTDGDGLGQLRVVIDHQHRQVPGMLRRAACGSSGAAAPPVASVSSSPAASATSSGGSARASMVAFAQCMHVCGISDYPDPDANGNLPLNGQPGSDLNKNNPRLKAAAVACQSLRPAS